MSAPSPGRAEGEPQARRGGRSCQAGSNPVGAGRPCGSGQDRRRRDEFDGCAKAGRGQRHADHRASGAALTPHKPTLAPAAAAGERRRRSTGRCRLILGTYCACSCDYCPVRQRRFDRRAIGAALHDAILIFLHVGDGVGDPDAGADQQCDDRNRDHVHQHAAVDNRPARPGLSRSGPVRRARSRGSAWPGAAARLATAAGPDGAAGNAAPARTAARAIRLRAILAVRVPPSDHQHDV